MTRETVLKWFVGLLAFLVALAVLVWFVWVPTATEAGYEFVTAWGERGSDPGQFNDPTGIAVSGDEVFVSDSRNARIQVFDLDGNFKHQFGTKGTAPGQLGRPSGWRGGHRHRPCPGTAWWTHCYQGRGQRAGPFHRHQRPDDHRGLDTDRRRYQPGQQRRPAGE